MVLYTKSYCFYPNIFTNLPIIIKLLGTKWIFQDFPQVQFSMPNITLYNKVKMMNSFITFYFPNFGRNSNWVTLIYRNKEHLFVCLHLNEFTSETVRPAAAAAAKQLRDHPRNYEWAKDVLVIIKFLSWATMGQGMVKH